MPAYFLRASLLVGASLFWLLAITEVRAEGAIPSPFRFERTLKLGTVNEDVRYLQILLNRDTATKVGGPQQSGGAGKETMLFGPATKRAVITFQNKYAKEILTPAKMRTANGIVGTLTRSKLNALLKATSTPSVNSTEMTTPTVTASTTPIVETIPPRPLLSFDDINTLTRKALVNILCVSKRSGLFEPLSGSGVIIDPRGIILTNAHVGEYLLLKDYGREDFLTCTIRTGEPAQNRYTAKLLYISPQWIAENAKKINEEEASGTGENDFALLLITDTTHPDFEMPAEFPFVPADFSSTSTRVTSSVLAAGYPAGFLGGISIQRDLYPSSSIVQPGRVYSFKGGTEDIFSIGGSVLAQHGASGGPVVNQEGQLIGLIVTASKGAETKDRNLNALTMSHIGASFREHNKDDISSLFAGDVRISATSFAKNVFPALREALVNALLGK